MEQCEIYDCSKSASTSPRQPHEQYISPTSYSPRLNLNPFNSSRLSNNQGNLFQSEDGEIENPAQEIPNNNNYANSIKGNNDRDTDSALYASQYDNEEFYPEENTDQENENLNHEEEEEEEEEEEPTRLLRSKFDFADLNPDPEDDELDCDANQRKFEETVFQKAMIGIGPYLVEQAASVLSASRSYSGDLSYVPKKLKNNGPQTPLRKNTGISSTSGGGYGSYNASSRNYTNQSNTNSRFRTPMLPNIDESNGEGQGQRKSNPQPKPKPVRAYNSRSHQSLTKGFQKLRLDTHSTSFSTSGSGYGIGGGGGRNARRRSTTTRAIHTSHGHGPGRHHHGYGHGYGTNMKSNVETSVGQRLASARKGQIKELKCRVSELENELRDKLKENQTLARLQHRHEVALSKYENAEAELPKMIRSHLAEVRCLQENLRKAQSNNRSHDDKMKGRDQRIFRLEEENKSLLVLVQQNDLEERSKLSEQLEIAKAEQSVAESRVADLQRHIEILEKTHRHQISVETKKLRNTNSKLFVAHQEIDKLVLGLKEKERYISYMRIRQGQGSGVNGRNEIRLAMATMASMQNFRDDISIRSARTLPIKKPTRCHHEVDPGFLSMSMQEDGRLRRQRSETCGPMNRRPAHTNITFNCSNYAMDNSTATGTPRRAIFFDSQNFEPNFTHSSSNSPRGQGQGQGQGQDQDQDGGQPMTFILPPCYIPRHNLNSVADEKNLAKVRGQCPNEPLPLEPPAPLSPPSPPFEKTRHKIDENDPLNRECDLRSTKSFSNSSEGHSQRSQKSAKGQRSSGRYHPYPIRRGTGSGTGMSSRYSDARSSGRSEIDLENEVQSTHSGVIDPDDYYNFENVSVEDDNSYKPHKSLFMDALDSSCNVSSMGQSPLDSMRSLTHHYKPIRLAPSPGKVQGQKNDSFQNVTTAAAATPTFFSRPATAGPKFKLPSNTNQIIPSPNPIFRTEGKILTHRPRLDRDTPTSTNVFVSNPNPSIRSRNSEIVCDPKESSRSTRVKFTNLHGIENAQHGDNEPDRTATATTGLKAGPKISKKNGGGPSNMAQGGGDGPPSASQSQDSRFSSVTRGSAEHGFTAQRSNTSKQTPRKDQNGHEEVDDPEKIDFLDMTPRTLMSKQNRNKNNLALISSSSSSNDSDSSKEEEQEDNDPCTPTKGEGDEGKSPKNSDRETAISSSPIKSGSRRKSEADILPTNEKVKQTMDNNVVMIEAMFSKWKNNRRNACESSTANKTAATVQNTLSKNPENQLEHFTSGGKSSELDLKSTFLKKLEEATPRRNKQALFKNLGVVTEAESTSDLSGNGSGSVHRRKTEEVVTLSNPAYFLQTENNHTIALDGHSSELAKAGTTIFKPAHYQPFFSSSNSTSNATEGPAPTPPQNEEINLKLSTRIKQGQLPWLNVRGPDKNSGKKSEQSEAQSSNSPDINFYSIEDGEAASASQGQGQGQSSSKEIDGDDANIKISKSRSKSQKKEKGTKSRSDSKGGQGQGQGQGQGRGHQMVHSSILEPRNTVVTTSSATSAQRQTAASPRDKVSAKSGSGAIDQLNKDVADMPRKKFTIGTISSLQSGQQSGAKNNPVMTEGKSAGNDGKVGAGRTRGSNKSWK